jgi:molybdopterin converting factor small subunit
MLQDGAPPGTHSNAPTIEVVVHYWAQVRRAAGRASETVEVPASFHVAQLLVHLAQRHGESFRDLVFDDSGQLRRSNLILLGDRAVGEPELQRLYEGATVAIVSPIAGG